MCNRPNVFSFAAVIAFFAISIDLSQSMWTIFELNSLLDLNGTTSVIYYDLKPKRISRTTYGITGTVTFNDYIKDYELEVKIYHSASGSEDYVLLPLKKARTPACEIANQEYRNYLMKAFSSTSDLPNSEDKDICPLFEKRKYSITDCRVETKLVPQFLSSGWYKGYLFLYDSNGIQVSGVEINAHLI